MAEYQADVEEFFSRVLEVLKFLHTEFLRVSVERGLDKPDLTTALASLGVSTIDSLKAAILLGHYDDFQNSMVMLRRFEEHFTLMIYFTLCDDGTMLQRWFQHPRMVPSEKNHKVRTSVTKASDGLFKRNPIYDFKGSFDRESKDSVHATWGCTRVAVSLATGRYALLNPEMRGGESLAQDLQKARAVHFLGVLGPSTPRLIEFLARKVFSLKELSEVSPGAELLMELDNDILRWYLKVETLLHEFEALSQEAPI